MPGKIIQCLKKTRTENPLILIDEVRPQSIQKLDVISPLEMCFCLSWEIVRCSLNSQLKGANVLRIWLTVHFQVNSVLKPLLSTFHKMLDLQSYEEDFKQSSSESTQHDNFLLIFAEAENLNLKKLAQLFRFQCM